MDVSIRAMSSCASERGVEDVKRPQIPHINRTQQRRRDDPSSFGITPRAGPNPSIVSHEPGIDRRGSRDRAAIASHDVAGDYYLRPSDPELPARGLPTVTSTPPDGSASSGLAAAGVHHHR